LKTRLDLIYTSAGKQTDMATPKRRHKIRDADATKRKLLDAIGELLCQYGYAGLKVNKVARHIGKDKSVIRHFGKLVDLEKAYIREKDYWHPFFERFQLGNNPSGAEVKSVFLELMQENLKFFSATPEMQKIILWQISEENALMRTMSDAREKAAAPLLVQAENFTRASGLSFKAIIALLLGGSYYLVLHANSNKSTVCGIDVNNERDFALVMKTIGEVLEWAFSAEPLMTVQP
jgi:AcrR family transcriptional regulator